MMRMGLVGHTCAMAGAGSAANAAAEP